MAASGRKWPPFPISNSTPNATPLLASLHLVIPCWNDLKEKVQNESCIRVKVAMRFPLGHSAEQKLLATFWAPWALGALHKFHPAYMSLASQVMSQWIKHSYSLQRQGRLGKTPRLGQRGQLSEARSFHSINANVALHIMLPSLKLTYHLKIDGWKTTFVWGRPIFSGYVLFVLGWVHDMYIMLLLMSWCPVGLCAESW